MLQLDNSNLSTNKNSMGVVVSTHAKPDDVIADEDKSVFDWCQEGNTAEVMKILNRGVVGVNDKDSEVILSRHKLIKK